MSFPRTTPPETGEIWEWYNPFEKRSNRYLLLDYVGKTAHGTLQYRAMHLPQGHISVILVIKELTNWTRLA
jgi:hypothetical protein